MAGQSNEFKLFFAWASDEGYDVANAYDTERSRWIFWSPMTAALWNCWQYARALSRNDAEKDAKDATESVAEKP